MSWSLATEAPVPCAEWICTKGIYLAICAYCLKECGWQAGGVAAGVGRRPGLRHAQRSPANSGQSVPGQVSTTGNLVKLGNWRGCRGFTAQVQIC